MRLHDSHIPIDIIENDNPVDRFLCTKNNFQFCPPHSYGRTSRQQPVIYSELSSFKYFQCANIIKNSLQFKTLLHHKLLHKVLTSICFTLNNIHTLCEFANVNCGLRGVYLAV